MPNPGENLQVTCRFVTKDESCGAHIPLRRPSHVSTGIHSTSGPVQCNGIDGNRAGFAWSVMILPQIDQAPLYSLLKTDLNAVAAHNLTAIDGVNLPMFRCPSDPASERFTVRAKGTDIQLPASDYPGVLGYGNLSMSPGRATGMFYRNSSVRMRDITDGTSNTFLVGERKGKHNFVDNMRRSTQIPPGMRRFPASFGPRA